MLKNGLGKAFDGQCWDIIKRSGQVVASCDEVVTETAFNVDGTTSLYGATKLLTVDSVGNVFDGSTVDGIVIGSSSASPTIFSVNNIYGYFNDTLGIVTIPPSFNDALPFSEDLAAVKIGTKWGYIDKVGNIIIPTVFEQARPFKNGRAEVVIDGKKYFIDKKGAILND